MSSNTKTGSASKIKMESFDDLFGGSNAQEIGAEGQQSGEDFWVKAEKLYYTALIGYIWYSIQERMEEVEQFYNGIRQMKHEMRNHLTNIKGLMESGNYEDMQQYLSKMDESMNVFEITIQTGNAVTDVIVNDKQKAASKQGVQFQSEFSYPVSDRYDAYDIGIIVNNLLQNALEACEKMNTGERYITLSGKQKRKFFLIEVRNSFDGEIKFDSNTNLPVSDKEKDISLHGIGLSNVKREVEKYMGDLDIKVKKNEFSVTILLQERRTENEY